MRVSLPAILCVSMLWAVASLRAAEEKPIELNQQRIEQLAAMLPETPRGVGPTIEDREAWQAVAAASSFRDTIKQAEKILTEPSLEMTDELYLDFSKTGNRSHGQHVQGQHSRRFTTLVLAECIENQGRFLPGIEEAARVLCGEKTWVMPAHDKSLDNFKGKSITIDLRAIDVAWEFSTACYWLGDKLSPEVRKLIDDELERRIFTPFTSAVTTGKPLLWWLKGTNNWNSVCLSGVTGSALASIPSRERRAFFVAAMEQSIQNFLRGITPDGYCSEGVGYWNYGFGHYVLLAETVFQATGGKVDMMEDAHVRTVASFGRRMEILPRIYPPFADCHLSAQPAAGLMAFLSRRYGWGLTAIEKASFGLAGVGSSGLFDLGVYGFPNSASAVPAATNNAAAIPLRDWFSDAGILICRPATRSQHAMGAAIKGGHNAEQHNHNDVGSFVVAIGRSRPLLDPGSEVYTARTFSNKRYDSNVLNSFGHPVPRVAGQLQVPGREAAAKILKTEFTDTADTFVMDISSAYQVKELKKLVRTFVFSREGAGSLSIIDEVEFDSPQKFGTALVTFSPWKQLETDRLTVGKSPDAVEVEITATGGKVQVTSEEIHEDMPDKHLPTRLGIDLTEPVTKATITLMITPRS